MTKRPGKGWPTKMENIPFLVGDKNHTTPAEHYR